MGLFFEFEAQEPIYGRFVVFQQKNRLPKNESSLHKHCQCKHKNTRNNQTNTAAHLDDACSTVVVDLVT